MLDVIKGQDVYQKVKNETGNSISFVKAALTGNGKRGEVDFIGNPKIS